MAFVANDDDDDPTILSEVLIMNILYYPSINIGGDLIF